MVARKQTPDLLSDVIGQTTIKKSPPQKTRPRKARKQASIPVKQQTSKPVHQHNDTVALPQKPMKATFYLSLGSIQALEDIYYHLRKQSSPDLRTKVSKSSIIDNLIQDRIKQLGLSA